MRGKRGRDGEGKEGREESHERGRGKRIYSIDTIYSID